MKKMSYFVILLLTVLSGCSHTRPSSCLNKDAYPRPGSLCAPVDKLTVSTIRQPPPTAATDKQKRLLAQVLLSLIHTNPDIGIAGAKEKEQYASIELAQAAGRPTFDVSVSAGPQRVMWPEPSGNAIRKEVSGNLRQVLYDFGVIRNDVKRAEMTFESATSARVAKTEDVAYDMVDSLMKVRRADDLMRVTRDNIAVHQSILKLIQLREENGNGTVADIKRITARLESAKSALIDLTTQRADAAASFENLTSVNADNIDADILKSLKGEPEKIDVTVIEKHPSVISLKKEITALEYQLESIKAEKYPVIGLQGTVKASQSVSSPEDGDNQLSVYGLLTVKLPLLDGGFNAGKQQQILSRLDMARLKLEKERRSLWEDSQNTMRVTAADSARTGSLETRVAAAKKVAELNLEQFKNGGKSVFELLDGEADYFKAKGDLVEQDHNRKMAEIRALKLRGQLVRAILGLAPETPSPVVAERSTMRRDQYESHLPGVRVNY